MEKRIYFNVYRERTPYGVGAWYAQATDAQGTVVFTTDLGGKYKVQQDALRLAAMYGLAPVMR